MITAVNPLEELKFTYVDDDDLRDYGGDCRHVYDARSDRVPCGHDSRSGAGGGIAARY